MFYPSNLSVKKCSSCSYCTTTTTSLLARFSRQHSLVVFQSSLSDCKSSYSFRILLSILSDLNDVVVGMVSIFSPISNSSNLFFKAVGDRFLFLFFFSFFPPPLVGDVLVV